MAFAAGPHGQSLDMFVWDMALGSREAAMPWYRFSAVLGLFASLAFGVRARFATAGLTAGLGGAATLFAATGVGVHLYGAPNTGGLLALLALLFATVGCATGLRASGGALGVGRATRSCVISSFLLIIIVGYYMTSLFYS